MNQNRSTTFRSRCRNDEGKDFVRCCAECAVPCAKDGVVIRILVPGQNVPRDPETWISMGIATIVLTLMSLRQRLLNGGKSYGPMIMSDSPIAVELLGHVGYQHVVIDHEHSPTDVRSGQRLLQALESSSVGTTPIVRLPGYDELYMKKVLDSMRLPGGVLVPMVQDAETAKAVARSVHYPLQGIRGNAYPFVRGSNYGFQNNYMEQTQRDLLVMVQVETPAAIEAIPDIACVPGIDAIFIGPFDLSTSIGKTGRFEDPEVKQLLHQAEEAVRQTDCLLAGFRSPGRSLKEMFGKAGYSFVCGSVDLGLLKQAALQDVVAARTAMKSVDSEEP